MSTIHYNIEELATEDNIEWFNNLISKVHNCGNDHIIIHNTFLNTDIRNLIVTIANAHIQNENQSVEVSTCYTRKG